MRSNIVLNIEELKKTEKVSILVDKRIEEYIGPVCYTTYVGTVEDVKDKEIFLSDVDIYTQLVGKRATETPGAPRLHIYSPKQQKHLDKVAIKKWHYIHRGYFFEGIIN